MNSDPVAAAHNSHQQTVKIETNKKKIVCFLHNISTYVDMSDKLSGETVYIYWEWRRAHLLCRRAKQLQIDRQHEAEVSRRSDRCERAITVWSGVA